MKKSIIFVAILLCGITLSLFVNLLTVNNHFNDEFEGQADLNAPKPSVTPFQLIEDFTPSTYYISPESSPGENDGVIFTFMANKDGNYTLDIKNFPGLLTQTVRWEYQTDFFNINGTDNWYLS
ncbi:MAG: hypothetical protein GF383_07990 [Candidatus Lokiarchaeota archaeon]|nr:hypothetical protein [Candidatus Lokiarchaeota archaeon]MBD3340272.1 hypothetical protein [Candidatus Lokiarchaeota archaeon]